jgi:hypothetical protein
VLDAVDGGVRDAKAHVAKVSVCMHARSVMQSKEVEVKLAYVEVKMAYVHCQGLSGWDNRATYSCTCRSNFRTIMSDVLINHNLPAAFMYIPAEGKIHIT